VVGIRVTGNQSYNLIPAETANWSVTSGYFIECSAFILGNLECSVSEK